MNRRLTVAAALLAVTFGAALVQAQTKRAYVPARTPWGDPDLQGDFTKAPFEYACHEGSYAMRNLLSIARAEEAAATKK